MRFPRNHQVFKGRFDGAAFACTFFPLLLFLLLNHTLVYQPGYQARLPDSSELSGFQGPFLVVTIDSSGRMFYESQWIEENELTRKIRKEVEMADDKDPLKLLVTFDRDLKFSDTIRITDIARNAGIQEVIWATRPPFYTSDSKQTPE